MSENPLHDLTALGQSVWIDHLARGRIASGEFRRHIAENDLRGVTSNPAIFEKSIGEDPIYAAPIRSLARRGKGPTEIYEALAIEDTRLACDELREVFERLDRQDGFASLEVSPILAYDTLGTIDEARRLWRAIDRPNAMIKVPATRPGLLAIEQLIAEGININVTLLFGLDRYAQVADAYISGLQQRAKAGQPVRVPSVASFFLSRIDVAVDAELEARERSGHVGRELAARLRGQTAIASARLAYQYAKRIFAEPRFRELSGARPQRLLWASTGTKNPAYGDVYYVDALIGEGTIDTMPLATFEAYRDHGKPARRLENDLDRARRVFDDLWVAGIDLKAVTQELEQEGVRRFEEAFTRLLETVAGRRHATA